MVTNPAVGIASRVRHDDPAYVDALMFLIGEAELLDADDLTGWLELLAPELDYVMPVQTTRPREDPGTSRSFHLREDRASLELRVRRRLESSAAWSENPTPRTRRFVSNVRVRRTDGTGLRVSSYLLLLRSRQDLVSFDLISAERSDLLVRDATGGLLLRSREITIDQARLGVANLPIPL
jgi:3-phenylpropionate/cinnamic acid dioxygenase small subunit